MALKQLRHDTLALDGGAPVRSELLPYGRQSIDDADVNAVVQVLRSSHLTCGPAVGAFEERFAAVVGSQHAVAVSSGTAALHAAYHALGIGPGDEVLVPAITFAATANAVLYTGANPIFCDVDRDTLLIDPKSAESRITKKTKAIAPVDYAGQPCDYAEQRALADSHGLSLIEDACHSLGGSYQGKKVGSFADCTAFSFHPVKMITTGEGGMVTTNDSETARRLRQFRSHGISTSFQDREKSTTYEYEMTDLGFNYRLTDIQCALGMSQLCKLDEWTNRRRELALRYDEALKSSKMFSPLETKAQRVHGRHLYVIRIKLETCSVDRLTLFRALRAEGIAVNVHYAPVHLHPYYRNRLGTEAGLCPVAEYEARRIFSIPIFPAMTNEDLDDVLHALNKVELAFLR